MNLRMAIGASQIENKGLCRCPRRARMTCFIMTTLAEPRAFDDQQIVMVGAVRVVTIQTVFSHRRMFPKLRPAFFGVAFGAILVYRVLYQLGRIGGTMRIMAVHARNLPLH